MSKRTTPTALAAHSVPLPDQGSADLPAWVHLLPAGRFLGRDGRGPYFVRDMRALLADSLTADGNLIIDENHATDLAAPKGGPSPARGLIVALEAREDGVWGQVEWNAAGAELVSGRAYRFLSPVFEYGRDGTVTRLLRAALTNIPNLRLTALNSEDPWMDDLNEVRTALGVAADADPEAIATHARQLREEADGLRQGLDQVAQAVGAESGAAAADVITALNSRFVGVDAHQAVTAELTALQARLEDEAVERDVDRVILDRRATPGERPHLAEQRRQMGADKFKAAMSARPPLPLADGKSPAEGAPPPTDAAEIARHATAWQADQAAKGISVSTSDAVRHVMKQRG